MPRGKDIKNRKQGATKAIKSKELKDKDRDFWLWNLDILEKHLMEYAEDNDLKNFVNKAKNGNAFKRTPLQVIEKGIEYVRMTLEKGYRPTITLLCNFLGVTPSTFRAWEGKNIDEHNNISTDLFKYPVGALSNFVASIYEHTGDEKINPAFPIFMLKNLGFEDKQVVEDSNPLGGFSIEERDKVRERLRNMLKNEEDEHTRRPIQNESVPAGRASSQEPDRKKT